VYVATEHDSVYAFDADSNTGSNAVPLWQVSFINPSRELRPFLRATSIAMTSFPKSASPAPRSSTLPRAPSTWRPKTKEFVSGVTSYVHRLHALDVATGAEKFGGPVLIQASVAGTGDGNDGSGNVPFDSLTQLNRTGLLLNNGVVYLPMHPIATTPYHGWLFGYDAATLVTNGFSIQLRMAITGAFGSLDAGRPAMPMATYTGHRQWHVRSAQQ